MRVEMRSKALFAIVIAALAVAVFAGHSLAGESKFRKSFRTSYEQNRFDAMGFLVKQNKDILPGEIQSLVDEAKAAASFGEKMQLLDLANTMATMHKEWHGNEKFLGEIEKLQREEIQNEEARKAEAEKWKKYENFPGNLIMKEKETELAAIGLSPVIFPHWVHRINFECKACHPALFPMKKTNSITMTPIFEGRLCGECHNGKIAFDAAESCERCHVAGRPEEAALLNPKKADIAKVMESSERLKTELNLDLLPNKALPFDKFGNIDWMLLKGAHKPIKSLKEAPADQTRDNEILFESPMPYVNNIVFRHKPHADLILCSSCHTDIYKEELGSTPPASMTQMAQGQSCGSCHGKVSFKFADCNRCHSKPVSEGPGKAMIRKK
ncbi:MAG: hypothetical protein A2054_03105 [Deltaproteobacteria bacterium GWA2_55_10]|nr:MAG: hypothetical protein A2054_03105 [Deltaproteobacteria bacterium GWA2_55_10]